MFSPFLGSTVENTAVSFCETRYYRVGSRMVRLRGIYTIKQISIYPATYVRIRAGLLNPGQASSLRAGRLGMRHSNSDKTSGVHFDVQKASSKRKVRNVRPPDDKRHGKVYDPPPMFGFSKISPFFDLRYSLPPPSYTCCMADTELPWVHPPSLERAEQYAVRMQRIGFHLSRKLPCPELPTLRNGAFSNAASIIQSFMMTPPDDVELISTPSRYVDIKIKKMHRGQVLLTAVDLILVVAEHIKPEWVLYALTAVRNSCL